MERLVQRYAEEKMLPNDNFLSNLQVLSWTNPSLILCCEKGTILFIEANEYELMYQDLCNLLKKVS